MEDSDGGGVEEEEGGDGGVGVAEAGVADEGGG